MSKFINRIINYILERRRKKLEQTMEKLKPRTYTNSTTKMHIDSNTTLTLSAQTEKNLEKVDAEVRNIVKPYLKDPEKLLVFIKEHGTPVHKFAFAQKVLKVINAEEGFVSPLKGFKAFYLNFAVGLFSEKKLNISFKSQEMFVLRDMDINIYYMLHQFHKWYGFKSGLPGYESNAQELFKENLESMTDKNVRELSIEEIIALKEAIARDSEAADFVIQLAKESSGAKKVLNKMQQDGGAEI